MDVKELIKQLSSKKPPNFNFEQFLDDFVPNVLMKSDTLQQAYGITDGDMEELYRQGFELYQQNLYQEAISYFYWLVVLNPFIVKYWLGYGANLQLMKSYEKALQAYAIITLIDDVDPYPHFYAYECYHALGNQEEALKALKHADQRAACHSIFQPLRDKIRKLITKKVL